MVPTPTVIIETTENINNNNLTKKTNTTLKHKKTKSTKKVHEPEGELSEHDYKLKTITKKIKLNLAPKRKMQPFIEDDIITAATSRKNPKLDNPMNRIIKKPVEKLKTKISVGITGNVTIETNIQPAASVTKIVESKPQDEDAIDLLSDLTMSSDEDESGSDTEELEEEVKALHKQLDILDNPENTPKSPKIDQTPPKSIQKGEKTSLQNAESKHKDKKTRKEDPKIKTTVTVVKPKIEECEPKFLNRQI